MNWFISFAFAAGYVQSRFVAYMNGHVDASSVAEAIISSTIMFPVMAFMLKWARVTTRS